MASRKDDIPSDGHPTNQRGSADGQSTSADDDNLVEERPSAPKRARIDINLDSVRHLFEDVSRERTGRLELTDEEAEVVANFANFAEAVYNRRTRDPIIDNTPCSSRQADLREAKNANLSAKGVPILLEEKLEVVKALIAPFPGKDFEAAEAFLNLRAPQLTDRVPRPVAEQAKEMAEKIATDDSSLQLPTLGFLVGLQKTIKLDDKQKKLLNSAVKAFDEAKAYFNNSFWNFQSLWKSVVRIHRHSETLYDTARRLTNNLLAVGLELQKETATRLGLEIQMAYAGEPMVVADRPALDEKLTQVLERVADIQSHLDAIFAPDPPRTADPATRIEGSEDETSNNDSSTSQETSGHSGDLDSRLDEEYTPNPQPRASGPDLMVVYSGKLVLTTPWAIMDNAARLNAIHQYQAKREVLVEGFREWGLTGRKPASVTQELTRKQLARYYFFLFSIPDAIEDERGNLTVRLDGLELKTIPGPIPAMSPRWVFERYFQTHPPELSEVRRDIRNFVLKMLNLKKVRNANARIRQIDPMTRRRKDEWDFGLGDVVTGIRG